MNDYNDDNDNDDAYHHIYTTYILHTTSYLNYTSCMQFLTMFTKKIIYLIKLTYVELQ